MLWEQREGSDEVVLKIVAGLGLWVGTKKLSLKRQLQENALSYSTVTLPCSAIRSDDGPINRR